MFFVGAISFTICMLVENRSDLASLLVPLQSGSFWVSILFLAGCSSVIAFLMINYAMTYVDAAKAAVFSNLTTVISILAGVFILNESFGLWQAIGSVIIIASVYGVNMPVKTKAAR